MKVLVVGSGGREHALTWAIAKSSAVKAIYTNSQNAGILSLAQPIPGATSLIDLADFAANEGIDLTVVGPEQPLVDGIVDLFLSRGLTIFGPMQAAARLEGSKVFAKEFMQRHSIPTAYAEVFNGAESALFAISEKRFVYPLVIKAEGLAAGKGVVIAEDELQAQRAIKEFMVDRTLGEAGNRLLIEECLVGRELSYLIFTDGQNYSPLPVAQDYKRAFDDNRGPNTGGMGAFSTPGLLDEITEERIRREIVEPTLEGARAEGFPFRGVLYFGLMLTPKGPQVLEYNVRLGDPETQAVLRRLDSDLVEVMLAVTRGELNQVKPQWSDEISACVVMASNGYPGSYQTGKVINGLDEAEKQENVIVFQAGTKRDGNQIVTAGGRVLAVTARAKTLDQAIRQAYQGIKCLSFEGAHYRKDIGQDGLQALGQGS
ncbi:MAG TPA: phosphoribosylamine--glycine ligase [Blastocatellia bacterium]|nr:phosphoribosylamine--glycine ligase [Blastocatellia bacterium]